LVQLDGAEGSPGILDKNGDDLGATCCFRRGAPGPKPPEDQSQPQAW
jgi:hypothetical protein